MNGTDGFPELRNWAVQPWIALVREAVRIPVLPPPETPFSMIQKEIPGPESRHDAR